MVWTTLGSRTADEQSRIATEPVSSHSPLRLYFSRSMDGGDVIAVMFISRLFIVHTSAIFQSC